MLDDIKKTLWATADKLRANMDAAEYKHIVLGLIFLKYISDTFAAKQTELGKRLRDPKDEYYFGKASDADLAAELEERDYYTAANVFWVAETARWEALIGIVKNTNEIPKETSGHRSCSVVAPWRPKTRPIHAGGA